MKVSDRDQASKIAEQYAINNKVNSDAGKKVKGALVPEEKVDLSSRAKEIQRVKKAVEAVPDVREDKVQDLKSRIEGGSYDVKADEIAEKMVKESLIDIVV